MLATLKKSGTLNVTRRAGRGRIDFRDGDVVYAETELSRSLLGQKLVQSGKITDIQLRQSLDVQATTGDRLGHILLVSEAVSPEDLQGAVRAQVEEAAYELMCWEAGDFLWEKGESEEIDADISLNVDDLIRVITGRMEDREEMRRRIQSPAAVPRLVARPPDGSAAINITPAQWRVMVLVDGSTNVSAIAEKAGATLEETGRWLYELASAGLIAASDPAGPEGDEERPVRPAPKGSEPIAAQVPSPSPSEVPEEWFEDPVEAVSPPATVAEAARDEPPVAFPTEQEELPTVGRAAAVRELSGLFDEPRQTVRATRRGGAQIDDSEAEDDRSTEPSGNRASPEGSPPPPPAKGVIARFARRNSGA